MSEKFRAYAISVNEIHDLFLNNKMEHLNALYKNTENWVHVDTQKVKDAVLNDAREFSNLIRNVVSPQDLTDGFLGRTK